jgi:hypothetical protein
MSMELGTAATGFHVTRLTEASFIVSTPMHAEQSRVMTPATLRMTVAEPSTAIDAYRVSGRMASRPTSRRQKRWKDVRAAEYRGHGAGRERKALPPLSCVLRPIALSLVTPDSRAGNGHRQTLPAAGHLPDHSQSVVQCLVFIRCSEYDYPF